jgi:hypothetical protein
MVFGTVPVDASLADNGKEGSNGGFSGQGSPVDLPLRLDDGTRRPQLHSAHNSK